MAGWSSKRLSHAILLLCCLLLPLSVPTSYAAPPTSEADVLAAPPDNSLTIILGVELHPPTVERDFAPIVLNGSVQTTTAKFSNWTVENSVLGVLGWHVTLEATQLTESLPNGSTDIPRRLPLGSLAMQGTRTLTLSGLPLPLLNVPTLQNQTAALDTGSPVTILNCGLTCLIGVYTVTEPSDSLRVTLYPQSTFLDKRNYPSAPTPYSTTLTFSLIAGP